MVYFELITDIKAPREIVFDLARSIDLHLDSAGDTREKVIEGRSSGLFAEGETATWEGTHFGMRLQLSSRVSGIKFPEQFHSCMVKGNFKKLEHGHFFEVTAGGTRMTDKFCFEAPFGIFGRMAEKLFLRIHMKNFLEKRNRVIKQTAESEKWKTFLDPAMHL